MANIKILPSPRTLIASLIVAFLAIWLANNVKALGRLTAPRG